MPPIGGESSGWRRAKLAAGCNRRVPGALGLAGVGLVYALEPLIAPEVAGGKLRVVLEEYAAEVPGLFLYYPRSARTSAAFRAFVDIARSAQTPKKRPP